MSFDPSPGPALLPNERVVAEVEEHDGEAGEEDSVVAVLVLVARGLSNSEIASALFLTEATVKTT